MIVLSNNVTLFVELVVRTGNTVCTGIVMSRYGIPVRSWYSTGIYMDVLHTILVSFSATEMVNISFELSARDP